MVRDEDQYQASRAHQQRLMATRAAYEPAPQADPLAQAALLSSVDTLLEEVEAELAEYEALQVGADSRVAAESPA